MDLQDYFMRDLNFYSTERHLSAWEHEKRMNNCYSLNLGNDTVLDMLKDFLKSKHERKIQYNKVMFNLEEKSFVLYGLLRIIGFKAPTNWKIESERLLERANHKRQ